MPIAEVTHLAMARQEEKLYDYIIVKRHEEYYGIISIKRLLEATMDIELNYARHSNPLSGLPGNVLIENKLKQIIDENKEVILVYFDINNFKPYNDIYGFQNGDKIIKFTANLIEESFSVLGEDVFTGHIGGDDFIAIIEDTDTAVVEKICHTIAERFDDTVRGFYTLEDINNGFVYSKNRQGVFEKFNLISMCIAVLNAEGKLLKTPHIAANVLSSIKMECKEECKVIRSSSIKTHVLSNNNCKVKFNIPLT